MGVETIWQNIEMVFIFLLFILYKSTNHNIAHTQSQMLYYKVNSEHDNNDKFTGLLKKVADRVDVGYQVHHKAKFKVQSLSKKLNMSCCTLHTVVFPSLMICHIRNIHEM